MQKMNNKKGVKLLAAVLAFAMVFVAGFAIIGNADESDAVDVGGATTDATSELEGDTLAGANVKVSTGKTVNVGTNSTPINLYIVEGITVQLVGTANSTKSITIYVLDDADTNNKLANDSSIVVTGFTTGTMSIVGTFGTASTTASSFVIGGSSDATITAALSNGSSAAGNGKLTFTSAGFVNSRTTNTSIAGVTFSASVKIGNTISYYGEGTTSKDLGSITLTTVNDIVTIVKGTATVSQGSNSIVLNGIGVSSGSVTVTGTSTTDAVPSIAGSNSSGTVKVTSGVFKKTSGTIAGATYAELTDSDGVIYLSNQISKVVKDATDKTIASAVVYGTVTQNMDVGASGAGNAGISGGITVQSNSKLIISDNITVYPGITVSNNDNSILIVNGSAVGALAHTSSGGKIYTGPNGYVSTAELGDVNGNTNVTSGSDFEIAGVPSSPSVGDSVIKNANTLTIPAGTEFTITGDLGLNKGTINVNGTLIISKNASIYSTGAGSEFVILGEKGKIINEGTIGSMLPVTVKYSTTNQTVSVQGVTGVEFELKSSKLIASGDVKAIRNAPTSIVTITNAVIGGSLTIGKDVTLNAATSTNGVEVLKNSVVVINGVLDGVGVKLQVGASITINGTIDATTGSFIDVVTGTYGNDNTLATTKHVKLTNTNNPSGFTVYSKKVAVFDESNNQTVYYLRAYVNGIVQLAGATPATTVLTMNATDILYIAADETLNVKKGASLSGANVFVDGTMIVDHDATAFTPTYVGAKYTIKTPATATTAEFNTVYYTSVSAALEKIDVAKDKTIDISVSSIENSFDVLDGQTVNIIGTTTVIAEDAEIVVKNGGTMTGVIANVNGYLVFEPESRSIVPTSYASKKVATDGTISYAGFKVAVSKASPGDTLSVKSATAKDLTLPEDVTVIVESLAVTGNLTVPEGAKLVGGSVSVNGISAKTAIVNISGELDLSEGTLSGTYFEVFSTGKSTFQTLPENYNGATYNGTDGDVLTSIANAVAYAKENSIASINVHGTVIETADLVIDGVNVVIGTGADVTLGKVVLKKANINSSVGDLTATVSGSCGKTETTGAVGTATVQLTKSSLTVAATETTDAAGIVTYTFSIDKIDGEIVVAEGTTTINTAITDPSVGSKLKVASGAVLDVRNTLTINSAKVQFTMDGTMDIAGSTAFTVSFSGATKTPVINGVMNIGKNATVSASNLVVKGQVNVSSEEGKTGTFNITDNGVIVGTAATSLGAAASINGAVTLTNGKYIVAYAGADMSKALINMPAAGESPVKKTTFFVNDVEYATAYAIGDVAVEGIITAAELNKLSGVDDLPAGAVGWKNAAGADVTNVGDAEAVYVSMTVSKVKVTISVGTGISLWVDGVKYNSGTTADLAVGEHQVKATVNPGYKGTVTITFNGSTVNNGKITVTSAMIGSASNVISATGDITIDAGETPAPAEKDGGMGITDYLLIVLVVLAAILVVIVAIRMMRS